MLKILKQLKAKEWILVLLSVGLIVLQVYLDLEIPSYMKELTILIQTPNSSMNDVIMNGGLMVLCALGSLVAAIVTGLLVARIAATLSRRLREQAYGKVFSFANEEINKFSIPSLINRTTNDITQVQTIVAIGMQALIKAPITAIWAVIKIIGKSYQWTIAMAIAVLILFVLIIIMILVALPKFKKVQRLTDNVNAITREGITGVKVIRAYNAEAKQEEKFENANESLAKTNQSTNRIMSLMQPSMSFVISCLTLAIYWIGAYLINAEVLDLRIDLFSDMMVFSSYAMQILMSFMMLSMIIIILPRATVSAKRINEVLDTDTTIVDGPIYNDIYGVEKMTFDNVSFKYPDSKDYVLEDISFEAKKGEKIAFIGSTGSGKSTLINLIPRFFDPTEGKIMIDDINMKEYKQTTLRNIIGYVPQKAVLFSGSIEDNIIYGDSGANDSSKENINKALVAAKALDFVMEKENGLSSAVSQSGKNFSGGQKQRLSIARAIARKPRIYVFDDSFSALDFKTDKEIRKSLKKITKDAIVFIVAQRIGTIKDADRIIVLDEGRLVGNGTHQELMADCKVYQEIALSQLSKEELA